MPFLRSRTTACSRSPLASVRACLQSIIGAPVFSRSSFTWVAEIFTVDVLMSRLFQIAYSILRRWPLIVGRWQNLENLVSPKEAEVALTNFDPRRTTRAGLIFPQGPKGLANDRRPKANNGSNTSGSQPAERPHPRLPWRARVACALPCPGRLPY